MQRRMVHLCLGLGAKPLWPGEHVHDWLQVPRERLDFDEEDREAKARDVVREQPFELHDWSQADDLL